ncbi:MAG: FAD-dependent oxidoreductase [Spirochaetaceae bacterium]|jgi:succinate dehydrogenase/fumarate reductase flavoprotein subunit|nr:FAD-dependent oxidoreductase [Spirochaetaceae bacterium]
MVKNIIPLDEGAGSGKGVSRRDFLKGTAVGAVGVAAAGILSACENPAASDGNPDDGIMTGDKANQKWSFEIAPPPITNYEEGGTADVVVVGAGMSGLTTALRARQEGASVILISASSNPISRGGSNSATHSTVMAEAGVPSMNFNDYFNREQLAGSYRVDQQKWSKFANHSTEAMNWLIDLVRAKGIIVALERDNYEPALDRWVVAHGFIPPDLGDGSMSGSGQQSVVEALAAYCTEAGVTIHYKNIARQLVRGTDNATGRVTGVIAETDGKYVKYTGTKGIVLATGDFSGDRDMLAKYCPWILPIWTQDTYTPPEAIYDKGFAFGDIFPGDGHKMGLWVGAAWQKIYPNAPMIQGNWGGSYQPLGFHQGLVVNVKGERFYNENISSPYSATLLVNQPQRRSYGIWTANFAQAVIDNGLKWYAFGDTYDTPERTAAEMIAQWEAGAAAADSPYKQYFKANTLQALCTALGISYATTQATLNRYNELANANPPEDRDFFKDSKLMIPVNPAGPFYAAVNSPLFMTITGGLRTDANMQVCDENDDPIPGLFNVGIMVGDVYANNYNFAIPGHSYGGNCLTFGYVLGSDLAKNRIPANA